MRRARRLHHCGPHRAGYILKGAIMADQETIPIGLETQNKVAEAI